MQTPRTALVTIVIAVALLVALPWGALGAQGNGQADRAEDQGSQDAPPQQDAGSGHDESVDDEANDGDDDDVDGDGPGRSKDSKKDPPPTASGQGPPSHASSDKDKDKDKDKHGDGGPSGDDEADDRDRRAPPGQAKKAERSGSGDDDHDEGDDDGDGERDRRVPPGQAKKAARHGDADDDDDDDDDERGPPAHARARAVKANFKAGFASSDGCEGRYVALGIEADENGTRVLNYTYRGTTFFDVITSDPAFASEPKKRGSTCDLKAKNASFKSVDNPTGHFKVKVKNGSLTLEIADGINATFVPADENSTLDRIVLVGPNNRTATLKGHNLTLDNGTVTGPKDAHFLVHAKGHRGDSSPAIDAAVEEGQVAAEIIVAQGDDGAPETTEIAHGPYELSSENADGSVTITIDGEGPGRTMLFNIERGTLGSAEDLEVLFDGELIGPADDLRDVLTVDEGEPAEYVIVVGSQATQVLVQIPHFSVHTITVQSAGEIAPPSPATLGSVAAFAAAALIAVAFVAVTLTGRNRQR